MRHILKPKSQEEIAEGISREYGFPLDVLQYLVQEGYKFKTLEHLYHIDQNDPEGKRAVMSDVAVYHKFNRGEKTINVSNHYVYPLDFYKQRVWSHLRR